MLHTLQVTPAPVQPVQNPHLNLYVNYICPMGVLHPQKGMIAVFDRIGTKQPFKTMSVESLGYTTSEVFLPIDPLSVFALNMATPEQLGYPAEFVSYLKLTQLM
jgi:hypothetical protein